MNKLLVLMNNSLREFSFLRPDRNVTQTHLGNVTDGYAVRIEVLRAKVVFVLNRGSFRIRLLNTNRNDLLSTDFLTLTLADSCNPISVNLVGDYHLVT
jgi:hypothetical protein